MLIRGRNGVVGCQTSRWAFILYWRCLMTHGTGHLTATLWGRGGDASVSPLRDPAQTNILRASSCTKGVSTRVSPSRSTHEGPSYTLFPNTWIYTGGRMSLKRVLHDAMREVLSSSIGARPPPHAPSCRPSCRSGHDGTTGPRKLQARPREE